MPKQYLENKLGYKIQYDPDGKKYRYKVNGDAKSSVTTVINTRTRPDLQNWYKKNRYDAIKEIMLEDGEPLDKINAFIDKVKYKAERVESFGREIGSQLHDWIDIYFKSKKEPSLPESEPLRTMAQKWLKFWKSQKFKVVASELPLYSSKFDCCGTNDVIVTKDSWNGQNAVLDWKTSKDYSFEQAIQVEMYRRFIEETTDFKIQKLAVVNIPKEPQKEVSMYIIKLDEKYFKGFKAMKYIDKLESEFNADLKQWKKENKKMQNNKYQMPFCGLSLKLYETGKKAPSMEYSASSTKAKFLCSLTKQLYGLEQVMDWVNTPQVQAYFKAGYTLKWGSKIQQAKETKYGADTEQVVTCYMVKPPQQSNVDGFKPVGQTMPQYKPQQMTEAQPSAPDHAMPVEKMSDMDDEIPF